MGAILNGQYVWGGMLKPGSPVVAATNFYQSSTNVGNYKLAAGVIRYTNYVPMTVNTDKLKNGLEFNFLTDKAAVETYMSEDYFDIRVEDSDLKSFGLATTPPIKISKNNFGKYVLFLETKKNLNLVTYIKMYVKVNRDNIVFKVDEYWVSDNSYYRTLDNSTYLHDETGNYIYLIFKSITAY